jgi:Ca2+-binding EF-hand superfamily protein
VDFQKVFVFTDYSDILDHAQNIITDLKEIIKANGIDIKKIFDNFDKDKQGTLDFNEFSKLIKVIAPKV